MARLRAAVEGGPAAEHVIAFLGQWWMVIAAVVALAVLWPRRSS